jgi:hypothetical protein
VSRAVTHEDRPEERAGAGAEGRRPPRPRDGFGPGPSSGQYGVASGLGEYGAAVGLGEHGAAPGDAGLSPGEAADRATRAILDSTLRGTERGVIVDSPPGAGKSTLVVRAARELVSAGHSLIVIAQTNAQVDDLVGRLATADPELPLGRLHSSEPRPYDPALDAHPRVVTSAKPASLAGLPVVVSTAAKWAWVKPDSPWPYAIVDEAYQMRSDALLAVAGLFERALFVGDPGQLDPFSQVGAEQWAGLTYDPSASAVTTLLAHNPGLPQHRLPVSWRLPASAAPLVSAAFYPYTPFRSGTGPGERTLSFDEPAAARRADGAEDATGSGTGPAAAPATDPAAEPAVDTAIVPVTDPAIDAVIDEAAGSGWGLLELPERHKPRTDPEAVAAIAALVHRLLTRGGTTTGERGEGPAPLTADRVAVGTAHRDQAAAVRAALARVAGAAPGLAEAYAVERVTVDTANRLQGREFDVTVVLHPLSGRPDATAFHLETGRLCVLTSRHRHACVVVCRAGVTRLLDEHPDTEPVQLGVPVKFPDGWEANQAVLAHLAEHTVRLEGA